MSDKWLNKYDQEGNKLTPTELKTLEDWAGYMTTRYKKVGVLKPSAKTNTGAL